MKSKCEHEIKDEVWINIAWEDDLTRNRFSTSYQISPIIHHVCTQIQIS